MNQMMQDPYTYIMRLYEDHLGRRASENEIAALMPYVQQGEGVMGSAFRHMIAQNPTDAQYSYFRSQAPNATGLTQDEARGWKEYMNNAANEQRAMNMMPSVAPSPLDMVGMDRQQIAALYSMGAPEQAALMQARWPQQPDPQPQPEKERSGGFGGLGGLLG